MDASFTPRQTASHLNLCIRSQTCRKRLIDHDDDKHVNEINEDNGICIMKKKQNSSVVGHE